jgi:N4-gp56 family major capsid protein
MPNAYETGVIFSGELPAWQRTYYDGVLMDTVRMKSIMVPFCAVKSDFRAKETGVMVYSEAYDGEPNWNALTESSLWLSGTHLDTRSVQLSLEIHGDVLKYSDYTAALNYLNSGDYKGLVKDKVGQLVTDTLDILARNAFLDHPNKIYGGGLRANREAILATDLFDPDFAETARVHLEEAEVPGIATVSSDDVQTIVCVTTPRVIHDIRTAAGSAWLEVQQYLGSTRKLTGEAGTWNGVRFVKTNRMRMLNHGAVVNQTTLTADTVKGQGAAATVDKVYTPGQSNSTRYVPVTAVTGTGTAFAVGDVVTIHSADVGEGAGHPPVETDGTQETRRIVAISVLHVSFDKPLMKAHASGDFMTKGVPIHASAFIGGPAVVYGIGESPTPTFPPKMDDLMMVNRIGWRGFLKFQQFRPEWIEVHETSGTAN